MYFTHKELLTPPIKRAAYSDRSAWLLAEMSRLAYLKFEKGGEPLKELMAGLKEADFALVKTFNEADTQAFLAERASDKMLVLAFRGTEKDSFADIWSDLNVTFYTNAGGAKIHSGFHEAFKTVEPAIEAELKNFSDRALYITGHSLGGALALVASASFDSDTLAACYTFGSPQVGGAEFAKEIKTPVYRIVNALDPVPALPPSLFFRLIFKLFKGAGNSKVKNLVKGVADYTHYGDMRFLTRYKNDRKELDLIYNYNEWKRLFQLVVSAVRSRQVPVEDHKIEEYVAKLGEYAVQRND